MYDSSQRTKTVEKVFVSTAFDSYLYENKYRMQECHDSNLKVETFLIAECLVPGSYIKRFVIVQNVPFVFELRNE